MSNDLGAKRPQYSKYFWAPVYIVLGCCFTFAVFLLGAYTVEEQRSNEYLDRLAVYGIQAPILALSEAEKGVRDNEIEFPVYRDLLDAALRRQDADARNAAFQSIAKVLSPGDSFSHDLTGC
jgi:hypothetical protein